MFKHAIASPAPEIAGAINMNCFIERISLKDLRRQVRIVPVSQCETSASNDDFTYRARRNRRARLILYADFHSVYRAANRDDTSVGKTRRGEDLGCNNSGLCRRIVIPDAPIAFEMPAETNNVLCVEPFTRCTDEAERRKPKIVG